jgi:hypothetical protein
MQNVDTIPISKAYIKQKSLTLSYQAYAPLSINLSNQLVADLKKIYDLKAFINVPKLNTSIVHK